MFECLPTFAKQKISTRRSSGALGPRAQRAARPLHGPVTVVWEAEAAGKVKMTKQQQNAGKSASQKKAEQKAKKAAKGEKAAFG